MAPNDSSISEDKPQVVVSEKDASPPPPGPPPQAVAMDMALGHWKTQALASFIKSGLADVMNSEEFVDPSTLAKEANNLNANAVFRLLRYLASVNVCIEEPSSGGSFKLSPVGEVCTKSHPQSVAGAVLLEASDYHSQIWLKMPEYLETGLKTTKSAIGHDNYWDACKANPEHMMVFQRAMTGYSNDEATMMKMDFLSPTIDLSMFPVICDLGGAEGACAKALNERFPNSTYILADLQEPIDNIDQSTLPSNFSTKAADFFQVDTIPMADAYLLKHIIHDWDDPKCIQILSNIKATNPKATVFVIEFGPMPGPNAPHLSKIFDLHMALTLNGHERTQDEYNSLFEKAGYEVSQTHALAGGNHPMYIQEIVLKE